AARRPRRPWPTCSWSPTASITPRGTLTSTPSWKPCWPWSHRPCRPTASIPPPGATSTPWPWRWGRRPTTSRQPSRRPPCATTSATWCDALAALGRTPWPGRDIATRWSTGAALRTWRRCAPPRRRRGEVEDVEVGRDPRRRGRLGDDHHAVLDVPPDHDLGGGHPVPPRRLDQQRVAQVGGLERAVTLEHHAPPAVFRQLP